MKIPEEYFEITEKNVIMNPILLKLFGEDWIYSLFEIKDTDKQHPIFDYLVDSKKCQKLVGQLTIINENCNKIATIIKRLKN